MLVSRHQIADEPCGADQWIDLVPVKITGFGGDYRKPVEKITDTSDGEGGHRGSLVVMARDAGY